ncbi:MAG: hypothetical protein IIY77_00720 [Lachnospiraceae bacterium]|nr:hypothetical protein [Lachnospiraceae bacterium]
MTHRKIWLLLLLEAVILAGLLLLSLGTGNSVGEGILVPVKALSGLFHTLSEKGRLGSGFASALYGFLALLPLIPVFRQWGNKEALAEKIVFTLSALLFLTPLVLILISGNRVPAALRPGRALSYLCGILALSLLFLGIVLGIVRSFKTAGTIQLFRYLKTLLIILAMFFTAVLVTTVFQTVCELIRPQNGGGETGNVFFSLFSLIFGLIPWGLDLFIALKALTLNDAVLLESQEDILKASGDLSRSSAIALIVIMASSVLFNLLQIILMASGTAADYSLTADFPLVSLLLVLAAFLFSRLITENIRLKEENSSFI